MRALHIGWNDVMSMPEDAFDMVAAFLRGQAQGETERAQARKAG